MWKKTQIVFIVALLVSGCANGKFGGHSSSDALSEIKAALADGIDSHKDAAGEAVKE